MTGITAVTQIAMAMATDPGVYALLCGSGLSHGAQIPTGWQVQVDLVRRAAAAQVIDLPDDDDQAVEAFATATGVDPGYSELLAHLGATPTARRALLSGYFEPTDDDRAEGRKAPSAAHRAIARLAADGAVRVVLTTNFDDLIEEALTAAGVRPTVWAGDDAIAGAAPLEHQRSVVVVKLHGDYRQPASLRNTREELDAYHTTLDRLLDQVLDHYGLVVVGWSATWDTALAAAVRRAPFRRYRTWWAAHGERLGPEASALIEHRNAQKVLIDGADTFLPAVADAHRAIRDLETPAPLDRSVARRQLERRLADPQGRIDAERQLLDVVHDLNQALRDPGPWAASRPTCSRPGARRWRRSPSRRWSCSPPSQLTPSTTTSPDGCYPGPSRSPRTSPSVLRTCCGACRRCCAGTRSGRCWSTAIASPCYGSSPRRGCLSGREWVARKSR